MPFSVYMVISFLKYNEPYKKLLYSLQALTLAIAVASKYDSIVYNVFKVITALIFPIAAAPIYKKAAISYCIGDILLSLPYGITMIFGGVCFMSGHFFGDS